jgi:hypothetical protein
MGGPVGAVVGAAVGAAAGGLAGKAIAEHIDPTVEGVYWRENYLQRPYIETGVPYWDYEPAYRYGWEAAGEYPGRDFESIELDLERGWPDRRGNSSLTWTRARMAVRDAWNRVVNRNNTDSTHRTTP